MSYVHEPEPFQWSKRKLKAYSGAIRGIVRRSFHLPEPSLDEPIPHHSAHVTQTVLMRFQRERRALNAFVSTLDDTSTFYDVGACTGLYSLVVAQRHPGAEIHAFEPQPANLVALRHHLRETDAEVHAKAISHDNGVVRMQTASRAGDGGLSVQEQMTEWRSLDDPWLANGQIRYCRTLDDAPGNPTHLKIDVEGHEVDAMKGGLDKTIPNLAYLLVETHSTRDQIEDLVEDRLDLVRAIPVERGETIGPDDRGWLLYRGPKA